MMCGGEVFKSGPEVDDVSLDSSLSQKILEADSNLDRSKLEKYDEVEDTLLGGDKEVLKLI